MIIDLSVPLNENTPIYPGDPKTKISPSGVIEKDGYCDHYISVGTHVGTHIDAPAHMIAGSDTLDKIDINRFAGRGVYIKVTNNKFNLEDVLAANIQEGDIVLFDTGMIDKYGDPEEYFENYPQIPEEIAEHLVSQKTSMVGVDMCAPDHPEFPIHKLLLSNGVLIIENLTNLDQLAGKNFTVTALPLNVELDGCPARVIAKIQE